ncbi:hypothetical protein SAY86_030066 [Trapa natans]|uniref:Uncharacterized protein n=1 Tax=Trapa natans TaxID=22666 RepID=A0AAN7MK81_TRANT|nr:hypothetical protein SAY86_030066 [Trapa natans]
MEGNATRASSALDGDSRWKHDNPLFSKIMSRSNSTSYSSRTNYYCRSGHEGIPFEWEMQPGTPKHPHQEAPPLPPLSPPPAILSLSLPKPTLEDHHCHCPQRNLSSGRLVKLYTWKKTINKYITWLRQIKKVDRGKDVEDGICRVSDVDKLEESFDFWGSDFRNDCMASPMQSSRSSSASSSLSSSNGPPSTKSSKKISCIPPKLNPTLLYTAVKRS